MKALSLTQPWASLVALGAKRIETRSWSTDYRGPLAIHASKGMPRQAREFAYKDPAGQVLNDAGIMLGENCRELPKGAIVAVARLVAVHSTNADDWMDEDGLLAPHEEAFGDYSEMRFAWVLADVQALREPIPCKGALGLWTPDPSVLLAIEAQIPNPKSQVSA